MVYNATDAPNLSNVTNMGWMFSGCSSFNGAIGNWNTGNVTNMEYLFAGATMFNQPIGNWNTSQVTNMKSMFNNAQSFNQSISNWNTSQVTNMQSMFAGASAFNSSLNNWNTGNVTNMQSMFADASAFNGSLGNWNTSNVTSMRNMFQNAGAFNQAITNWNTQNVVDMHQMFKNASVFNQFINGWNTGNVTDMEGMFDNATAFNQPVGQWNTGNVTTMKYMFFRASAFNRSLNNWNTGSVTTMKYMFYQASAFNQSVDGWNTSQVTDMSYMFAGASAFNKPLNHWNTGNVTNMRSLFNQAASFNQPLDNWNTGNVTNMRYMFSSATSFDQSLSSWNMTQVTDITNMLYQCGMSVQSYDQTLIGWASQTVTNGLSLGARDLRYCKAINARATLTTHRKWSITGDAYAPCPEINLQYNGFDIDSGESIDLGAINVGGASAYKTFIIENVGAGDLDLLGTPKVLLQGAHTTDFTVIQHQLSSPIAPNTSQSFEVRFNPTQLGIRQASLLIYNNDYDENPYIIQLTGEGLGVPDIHLSQNGVEKPSGSVFNFGIVGILHPSAPFEFVVRNTGSSNLVLQNGKNGFVTISGAHAKDFRVTKISSNSVLAPGQSANFVVQLFPSATGIRQANLTIQSNDPDENPYTIYLEGASILDAIEDPKLQVSPNPTSDKLTLNTTQWQGEAININIRSEQGRLMMSQDIARAKDQLSFEVANYKTGWYVLMVSTKKGKYSYKFMKK
jgi:surface protein